MDKYEFYKDGCLLNSLKVSLHINNVRERPVIAKSRFGGLKTNATEIEVDSLAKNLE